MTDNEKDYFQTRAEIEIAHAQAAEHPEAVRSHYLLAGYYLDRVHGVAEQDSEIHSDVASEPHR